MNNPIKNEQKIWRENSPKMTYTTDDKHSERGLSSYISRELKVKAMRYHCTLIRMADIEENTWQHQMAGEDVQQHCCWESKVTIWPLWNTI